MRHMSVERALGGIELVFPILRTTAYNPIIADHIMICSNTRGRRWGVGGVTDCWGFPERKPLPTPRTFCVSRLRSWSPYHW